MNEVSVVTLKGRYLVSGLLNKSKARYAQWITIGDKIEFVLEMAKSSGASSGNYSLMSEMYVNGVLKTMISQNEYCKLLDIIQLSTIV